jgi:hypothetical protein
MTVLDRTTILQTLERHGDTLRSHGVKSISLFGSRAGGRSTGGSDIDLLVEFEEGRGLFRDFTGLHIFLEELFGVRVDLVKKHLVRKEFRKDILEGEVHAAQI